MKIVLIIIISIVLIALVVFTIVRNNKDRKKFERQLTNDRPTIKHNEGDIEIDDDTAKSSN